MHRTVYPIAHTYKRGETTMDKKYVSVFNAKIARNLLKKGIPIVDIKPFKENPDKTIFIFDRTQEVLDEIHSLAELR